MSIDHRVETIDWTSHSTDLDAHGWAMLENILTAGECEAVADLYDDESCFRSRVIMARHGFGRGEYKYRETGGLPEDVLHENWDRCLTIPMLNQKVRSLNLAVSVGIVVYEALRQTGAFQKA